MCVRLQSRPITDGTLASSVYIFDNVLVARATHMPNQCKKITQDLNVECVLDNARLPKLTVCLKLFSSPEPRSFLRVMKIHGNIAKTPSRKHVMYAKTEFVGLPLTLPQAVGSASCVVKIFPI